MARDEHTTLGDGASPSGEMPPVEIEGYRILAEIGEGGFGVVYEAEQLEPVRRRVAVKVIKPGMDSRSVVARFEAERQALAVMEHPCIARVFDGGVTSRQLPFFAMELVRGEPITDFCDRNRFSIERRVELFMRVCEAVQHAHMKGVIHRDLKPSNILAAYETGHTPKDVQSRDSGLEGVGVKVIDFGVAKALNQQLSARTMFTGRGQMIGTPSYMSPEQAEMSGLDIDTRADVYSLGVVLYELLTGALPFDPDELLSKSEADLQKLIREVDPPRPSTRLGTIARAPGSELATRIAQARGASVAGLPKRLRGDLEWITMRCLEKDRSRRYDTPGELSDDLGRHLAHEPVLAGPPGAGYRVRKFVARHRGQVVAGAVMLALLVGGVVATSWGMVRAIEQKRLAEERTATAERLVDFQSAMLRNVSMRGLGASALRRIAESAGEQDEASRGALRAAMAGVSETDLGVALYREHFLDPAVRALEDRFADEPVVRARVLRTIGIIEISKGAPDRAYARFEDAWVISRDEMGSSNPNTLVCRAWMGAALGQMGRAGEGVELLDRAYEGLLERLGAEHVLTLTAQQLLAATLVNAGRPLEAEPHYLSYIERAGEIKGYSAEEVVQGMNNLTMALLSAGEVGRGESWSDRTMARARERLGEGHEQYGIALCLRGWVRYEQGRLDEAADLRVEGCEILAERLGYGHPVTRSMMQYMDWTLRAVGREGEADRIMAEGFGG